jgi:hypothetical protein
MSLVPVCHLLKEAPYKRLFSATFDSETEERST